LLEALNKSLLYMTYNLGLFGLLNQQAITLPCLSSKSLSDL
jgi:hypothetical protein